MSVMRWLLEGDPAIRWQVQRDLNGAPPAIVAAERDRVATEGWGARLLAMQDPGGFWGGADDEGWMTTIDALFLLTNLGLDPAGEPARTAIDRVRAGVTWWQLGGEPFFDGETEACINGRILSVQAYFGVEGDALVERLLGEQLADGGWNCEAPAKTVSSFHSTICVLEGLVAYERARGADATVRAARTRAQEYLLQRRLLRSLRTGALIDRRWTRFGFPPTWHYDALRGLDALRDGGVAPEARMAEAIEVVRQRRHQNKRWPMNHLHHDRVGLALDLGVGRASRWNTLRAMRVLAWYERAGAPAAAGSETADPPQVPQVSG